MKLDLNKTSVINLLNNNTTSNNNTTTNNPFLMAYLQYLYIGTKELRMLMMNDENMDIRCGGKWEGEKDLEDLYMGPES